ncbi:uncharacterized protein METZ01_LOCUS173410, partial [marine metagenome]
DRGWGDTVPASRNRSKGRFHAGRAVDHRWRGDHRLQHDLRFLQGNSRDRGQARPSAAQIRQATGPADECTQRTVPRPWRGSDLHVL